MAIWQFDLVLVPRGGPAPLRNEHGYNAASLPLTATVQAHTWLCQHLGEPWLMLEGWLVFGEEQGNRFDFLFNEDGSAEVSTRIDARTEYGKFSGILCELAHVASCTLFSIEHWAFVEPTVAALSSALKSSTAAAFVHNPINVLGRSHHKG